jgi:hypothetical protein
VVGISPVVSIVLRDSRKLSRLSSGTVDSNFDDTIARDFGEFFEVLGAFPDGFNDHKHEEPFNSSNNVDNWDGFAAHDYYYNHLNEHASAVDTYINRQKNCYP